MLPCDISSSRSFLEFYYLLRLSWLKNLSWRWSINSISVSALQWYTWQQRNDIWICGFYWYVPLWPWKFVTRLERDPEIFENYVGNVKWFSMRWTAKEDQAYFQSMFNWSSTCRNKIMVKSMVQLHCKYHLRIVRSHRAYFGKTIYLSELVFGVSL